MCMDRKLFILYLFLVACASMPLKIRGQSQSTVTLTIRVLENVQTHPVADARLMLTRGGESRWGSTDQEGKCILKDIAPGTYTLLISHVSYIPYRQVVVIGAKQSNIVCVLNRLTVTLDDVYVTARESKGLTSSSHIGHEALEHIQPSSIADVLELLPGGYAKDPNFKNPSVIALREVGRPTSQYNTSSLGTAFVVDGRRINTDANMQWMLGATTTSSTNYVPNFMNSGVDMRSISTDDIDSIVVVRGIPSVKYGELTSGLLRIERKKGKTPLEARLKADRNTRLYYIGKGLSLNGNATLNVGLDYMDSNPEKRTSVYGYQRYTAGVRGSKGWTPGSATWNLSMAFDYTGSLNQVKADEEMNQNQVNSYQSDYSNYAYSMSLRYAISDKNAVLTQAELSGSVSYDKDIMKRTQDINLVGRVGSLQQNTTEGEFDAVILPNEYEAYQEVDGRPFYASVQADAKLGLPTGKVVKSEFLAGMEWDMSKNYGRGQVYDPERPPMGDGGYRQRPYRDIPASHLLGAFVENTTRVLLGEHVLRTQVGVRSSTPLHMDHRYAMAGHFFWDPRLNAQWKFPGWKIGGQVLDISLSGGIGMHSKMPTLDQLYPELDYLDIVEFVMLYPVNMKRLHYRTYIHDPINYALKPARNLKWEVRAELEVAGIAASVTWYREDMKSGFRGISNYTIHDYTKYSIPQGLDIHSYDGPIPLSDLNKAPQKEFFTTGGIANGSRTQKKGVEYTLMTPRYPLIATRFTVSGAWMFTRYSNSVPLYQKPTVVVGGYERDYIAKYEDDNSYTRWLSNTNFNADTYLPRLGLSFSASFQCFWTQSTVNGVFSSYPVSYIGLDGIEHAYTAESVAEKPMLETLFFRPVTVPDRSSTPFSMNVNLKATKKIFGNKINLAIFVNKLLDSHSNYTRNGVTFYRFVNPYFGMEMNIKL